MGSLSDVLKQRRKELGLTLAQVADAMNVAEATVQRWESGNIKSIRYDKINRLAEVLNVNPAALMGWDDSFKQKAANVLPVPNFSKKPRLGTIACGKPILAVEDAEEFDDVPDGIDCDFTLKCKGDSMINARIFDGDIVYIRHQDMVDNGEIAAVLIDDEATLKRVHIFDDHIVLSPENPMHKPFTYWGEEMNNVRILGKAVAFTSKVY